MPKKDESVKVIDFHWISLVRSVCKIVPKVLSTRLKEALDSTFSPKQIAYIAGRSS